MMKLGKENNEKPQRKKYGDRVREQRELKEHRKRLTQDPEYAASVAWKKYGLNPALYTKYDTANQLGQNLADLHKYLTDDDLVIASTLMHITNVSENNKIRLLGSIVEQNWITIRQNEAILQNLEALNHAPQP